MVRIATPDHAAPELDIKLNQNPNAFFFPASTISGHVIYKNHHGNADYDLRLRFVGLNRVVVRDGKPKETICTATLFEYAFSLHTARKGRNHILANSQVDTAPMFFPFKHRFPAATDNRSFSLTSNTSPAFSTHVHDLPPSFEAQIDTVHCSIEYCLCAELLYDNCSLGSCTLPIMFLPYTKSIQEPRYNSALFTNPTPFHAKNGESLRKDSVIGYSNNKAAFGVAIRLPDEITVGIPFAFEIQIQLPFRPTFDDEVPVVKVPMLRILSMTDCHIINQSTGSDNTSRDRQYHKTGSILLRPSAPPHEPTLDAVVDTIFYAFQATLSSFYPPTFRSFLISSSFAFETPISVEVNGVMIDVGVGSSEVNVLSPVAQQTSLRKTSKMARGPSFATR
jgi:hypothetical protein